MKTAVIASLIASAAAFAPASQKGSSTALNADLSNELGAMTPLGFFDPLGIVKDGDKANFDRLRWVELKHGRVAMLGVVGYLVTYAGVRFPGAEDIPAGWAAWQALPAGVLVQMAFTWGVMEAFNRDASDIHEDAPGSEFPGDFRNGFLDFGWNGQSDDWKMRKRTIELNQGRAAQMGMLGLMVHDKLGNVGDVLPHF